jgi:hypothetical protein
MIGNETWCFSTTEAIIGHLQIAMIAKKEETATGQV